MVVPAEIFMHRSQSIKSIVLNFYLQRVSSIYILILFVMPQVNYLDTEGSKYIVHICLSLGFQVIKNHKDSKTNVIIAKVLICLSFSYVVTQLFLNSVFNYTGEAAVNTKFPKINRTYIQIMKWSAVQTGLFSCRATLHLTLH